MTGLDREIEMLSAKVKDNPGEAETWYSQGKAALLRGLNFAALVSFEKSRELKPRDPSSLLGIATALANAGMDKEALQSLFEFVPRSPYDLRGYLLFHRLKKRIKVPENMSEAFSCYQDVAPWKVRLSTTIEEVRQEKETLKKFMEEVSVITGEEDSLARGALALKKAQDRLSILEGDERRLLNLEEVATDKAEPEVIQPEDEGIIKEVDEETKRRLEDMLLPSLSIRGVTYSGIYSRGGKLLVKAGSEDAAPEVISEIVSRGFEVIKDFSKESSLNFWNLEFESGLLVFQGLGADYVLLQVGRKGATYGALRFHLERNRKAVMDAVYGGTG